MLLGTLGYLIGRERLPDQPVKGILIILLSLFIGVVLGTFSKENAALLPAFIGLLELSILSRYRPLNLRYWKQFGYLLLWGPIVLFAGYVVYSWPTISTAPTIHYRPFDWSTRLWSETLILWEYVRQLFMPDIRLLGPMQDDTTRILGPGLLTITATLGWIVALIVSFAFRNRYPLLLFGVGFFLIGHLIESTFIQLELYFEHRNYIPSLGLLAIPLSLAWLSTQRWPRLLIWFGIIPLLALLLFVTTRGWGDPGLSSERWYEAHPTSLRAIQHRASVLEYFESLPAAARFTASASDYQPERLNIAALALGFQCKANDRVAGVVLLDRIQSLVDTPQALQGAMGFLGFIEQALVQRSSGKCPWLEYDQLFAIYQAIGNDPGLQQRPADLARFHLNMGLLQLASGNRLDALNSLHQGYSLHRNYHAFSYYTGILRSLGLATQAEALRDEFLADRPADISTMEEHRRRVFEAYAGDPIEIHFRSSTQSILRDSAPNPTLPTEILESPKTFDTNPATTDDKALPNPQ